MSAYDELIDFVTKSGISQGEAEFAVRQCALAMTKRGIQTYMAGGAIAYFMSMNPSTAIPFLIGSAAVGAGSALVNAPQCEEVREAVRYWTKAQI
jgi:hypothetical protein